jgi:hypothetical protein
MTVSRRHWWLVIVIAVALIDIVGRLALGFAMARVIVFESVLFLGACMLIAMATARYPSQSLLVRRGERVLAVVFGLAGLRVMVWAAGAGVGVANCVVLGIGLMLALALVIRTRYFTNVSKS